MWVPEWHYSRSSAWFGEEIVKSAELVCLFPFSFSTFTAPLAVFFRSDRGWPRSATYVAYSCVCLPLTPAVDLP